MASFKVKDDDGLLIINNKIEVSTDCLGLRFERYNIPNNDWLTSDNKLTVLGAAIELKSIVREVEYYDVKKVNSNYDLTVPTKVVFEKNGWLLTFKDNRWKGISTTISKLKHNSKSSHTKQLRTQDEQYMYSHCDQQFIAIHEMPPWGGAAAPRQLKS